MVKTSVQVVINGILMGGVYSLISIGLTLIFGVMRVINFAHGEFLMIGMYFTFWMTLIMGIDPYICLIFIGPVFFLLGAVTQRFIIQPVIGAPIYAQIFATIGLSFALQNLALMLWRADYRSIESSYVLTMGVLEIWGLRMPYTKIGAFVIAMGMAGGLFVFLKRTKTGKAIRAASQDLKSAQLVGVNIRIIFQLAFGIGTACVGIAGVTLIPMYPAFPTIGLHFVLVAYVVVVLGGLGNIVGAVLGGLCIGLIEVIAGYYISPALKETAYFVVFIFILLGRPTGIFGEKLG